MNTLTQTETDVLRLIAGRMTTAEIAFTLDIAQTRLDQHVADAIAKLEAEDADAAVAAAIDAGLIPTNL